MTLGSAVLAIVACAPGLGPSPGKPHVESKFTKEKMMSSKILNGLRRLACNLTLQALRRQLRSATHDCVSEADSTAVLLRRLEVPMPVPVPVNGHHMWFSAKQAQIIERTARAILYRLSSARLMLR